MVKIQPFGDRVAIEILQPNEYSKSGLLIASVSKEKSNKGKVVAIGDGEAIKNINIGDKIIFNMSSGLNYSTGDEEFKILELRDIIGKIVEE